MHSVYIHSKATDFAPTELLSERAYLGRRLRVARGGFRLLGCGCGKAQLVRIYRQPWMRLVPFFRQYRCFLCGARVLRLRMRQPRVYGAWS